MDNSTLQAIRDLLSRNDQVGIAVGKNPTIDEMGAALSLYLALEASGKKVSVACPSEPLVEVSSLVGIDKVKKQLDSGGGDLIVSFPFKKLPNGDSEIKKVSYTLEEGYLNIVVKPAESGLSFSERDVEFRHAGQAAGLLFIVGTPRLSDLGSLFDPQELKDVTIVNIDNKGDNQGFGDVVLVSPQFSSVSEQTAQLITSLDLLIDIDIAQNLMSGISFATNNFQSPRTSFLAFEMASVLLKKGARREAPIQKDVDVDIDSSFFFPQEPVQSSQPVQQRQKREPVRQRLQPQPRQTFERAAQDRDSTEEQKEDTAKEAPPADWLTPKVYKGSTLV